MKNKIYYSVLGGGQEIGASCHYLEFGSNRILLDCGMGHFGKTAYGPDFTPLLERQRLPGDIQAVFVSHAHFDHIGYFPNLFRQCGTVPIYTGRLTTELGRTLLWDNLDRSTFDKSPLQMEQYAQEIDAVFESVNGVEYAKPLEFGDYRITFYEAGHIPGAAMIYLETESGSILYTGDFSAEKTSLTNGAILPEGLKADTVILDGTYAKRPGFRPYRMLNMSLHDIHTRSSGPVCLRVKQLTKGVELLNSLTAQMDRGELPKMRIYMDDNVWNVAQAFLRVGLPVLSENCYLLSPNVLASREKAIYIMTRSPGYAMPEYEVDFSLHAGFDDLRTFILKHAKENVAVVHAPLPKNGGAFFSLEDACDDKLRFLYPETGDTYIL